LITSREDQNFLIYSSSKFEALCATKKHPHYATKCVYYHAH